MAMRKDATLHAGYRGPAYPVLAEPPVTGAGTTILVTLLGAAGLMVGAFFEWIRPDGIAGTTLSYRIFFDPAASAHVGFVRSAGFAAILVGSLAVAGLAFRTGWITRLAGALGIIGFALVTITLHRAGAQVPESLGVGAWMMLGGGLLALFGGFFATRPRVIVLDKPA